jgi:hypothetical protein
MQNLLRWSPRLLAAAYILSLAAFALDAFEGPGGATEKAIGFLAHLTPAIVTAMVLAVAWRFPLVGGVFFMLLGMVFTIYFQTDRAAANFLMISMPLFVAGVLFIFSHAGGPQKPVF